MLIGYVIKLAIPVESGISIWLGIPRSACLQLKLDIFPSDFHLPIIACCSPHPRFLD